MQPQSIFNIEKLVLHLYFQRKANLIHFFEFADSLSLWKFKSQTHFLGAHVGAKNRQKLAFRPENTGTKRKKEIVKNDSVTTSATLSTLVSYRRWSRGKIEKSDAMSK